jgi:uncharacterized damage-inducible protein DinB
MKEYFINLLKYDRHSNLQLNNLLLAANAPHEAVRVMSHLLMAQKVWLSRCNNTPTPVGPLWPDWQAVHFNNLIEENSKAWIAYVNNLTEDGFNQIISYTNFRGDRWEDSLTNILAHLINHGTHHRAQIGQHLKAAGVEQLPVTDYIFYVRQQTQQ